MRLLGIPYHGGAYADSARTSDDQAAPALATWWLFLANPCCPQNPRRLQNCAACRRCPIQRHPRRRSRASRRQLQQPSLPQMPLLTSGSGSTAPPRPTCAMRQAQVRISALGQCGSG